MKFFVTLGHKAVWRLHIPLTASHYTGFLRSVTLLHKDRTRDLSFCVQLLE